MSLDENRARQFGAGLIYDAIRWTPQDCLPPNNETLLSALKLLGKEKFTEDDLHSMSEMLRKDGYLTSPPALDAAILELGKLEMKSPGTIDRLRKCAKRSRKPKNE